MTPKPHLHRERRIARLDLPIDGRLLLDLLSNLTATSDADLWIGPGALNDYLEVYLIPKEGETAKEPQ